MIRRPPRSTRTDTLFPYTTLFRSRDLSTRVLGQDLSMPVLISPTGVQMVHPEAEIGIARAAANRGTALGLPNFGSTPMEPVMAQNPKTLFQLYWCGTRDPTTPRTHRAKRADTPAPSAPPHMHSTH